MKFILRICVILYLSSTILNGDEVSTMNDKLVKKAETILLSAEVFAQKRFGGELEQSEYSWALSIILDRSRNPSEVFYRLASSRRKYALIYAIVGAFRSDRELYHKLKIELSNEEFGLWYKVGGQTLALKVSDVFSMLESDNCSEDFIFGVIPDFFETVRPLLEDSFREVENIPINRAESLPKGLKINN